MNIDKLEQFDRTMNSLLLCLNTCPSDTGGTPEWFISFGTLLGFCRDRGNIGDIDISMFYDDGVAERLISTLTQFNFQLTKKIVEPMTGQPYYASFKPMDERLFGDNHVDIFFWVKIGDTYYHTYDMKMENPQNGIPSEYTFKGVPGSLLRGPTWHETWPDLKHVVRLPQKYGSLLDYWYPGWLRKDSYFGQSKSRQVVTVKNPADLHNESVCQPQIEISHKEYEEFKDAYRRKSCL